MKGLILAALVGFVLAITLAIPFTEDEIKAYNTRLEEIRNDVTQRYVVLILTLVKEEKIQHWSPSNFYRWKSLKI